MTVRCSVKLRKVGWARRGFPLSVCRLSLSFLSSAWTPGPTRVQFGKGEKGGPDGSQHRYRVRAAACECRRRAKRDQSARSNEQAPHLRGSSRLRLQQTNKRDHKHSLAELRHACDCAIDHLHAPHRPSWREQRERNVHLLFVPPIDHITLISNVSPLHLPQHLTPSNHD